MSKAPGHRSSPRPISAYAAAPVDPSNWNPFSSKGSLSALAFAVTLFGLAGFNYAAGENLHARLLLAKATLVPKKVLIAYGIWAVFCSVGFLLVTNTFIKRWTAILGREGVSVFERGVVRLALLSPLLSIYALIMTLLFSRKGPSRPASKTFVLALSAALFIPFHLGLLAWRHHTGEIELRPGFQLALSESHLSPGESIRRMFEGHSGSNEFPFNDLGESFYMHAFPYLSPILKYSTSMYSDYKRVAILADEVNKERSRFCAEPALYLEWRVSNCFMARYAQLAKASAFSGSIAAFYYEAKYRQKAMQEEAELLKEHQFGVGPDQQAAAALLAIHNPLSLLEPNTGIKDRREFVKPIGLLKFFGSPEIMGLEFGQDLQRYILSERVLPVVAEQMGQVEQAVKASLQVFSEGSRWKIKTEMEKIKGRIAALREDPFQLKNPGY